MDKPGVRFRRDACELFGQRILLARGKSGMIPAVIKSWTPCALAAYGVVFDDKPSTIYQEDLLRRGRKDWQLIDWEADEWETFDLRPLCPKCGHPLKAGRAAWTLCVACGFNEPGASSTQFLGRLRTDDPSRKRQPSYAPPDSDEDDPADLCSYVVTR